MCRLLGYVNHRAIAARDALRPEGLAEFAALSRLHRDGWGMAWCDGDVLRRASAPTAAADDPEFNRLAGSALADAGLIHLRWATDGLDVQPTNTHPFLADGLALAHNGSITPVAEVESLLSAESRAALTGTTDSERYFRLVLERVRATGDTVSGVREAVEILAERFPRASLNAIVMDADRLIAVHASSSAAPPVNDVLALYPDPTAVPDGHCDRYFHLRYRVTDDGVVISSTGLTSAGWLPIPDNCLLVVDRADAAVHRVPLRTTAAVPAVISG